jgi:hypothetical protein
MEFGDGERDVAHMGCKKAMPAAVAVAESGIDALMALGTEHSSDLQLNELLQALAHDLRDQLRPCCHQGAAQAGRRQNQF